MSIPFIRRRSSVQRRHPIWHRFVAFVAYFVVSGSWLPLAVLFIRSGGNPDAYLGGEFGPVSKILRVFSPLHTLLFVIAIAAVFFRRFDVVALLPFGPGVGLLYYVIAEGFSDPAWFTIVAICSIGEMVAIVVGLLYWAAKRTPTSLNADPAG
jgi:hypothetical protein